MASLECSYLSRKERDSGQAWWPKSSSCSLKEKELGLAVDLDGQVETGSRVSTHCGNHCEQQGSGGKGRPNVYRRDKQASYVFEKFIMFNSELGG